MTSNILNRLLFLFIFAVIAPAAYAQPSSEDLINTIERPQEGEGPYDELSLAELMDTLNVPGLSIAVIKDFEIHWAKGYGVADIETGDSVHTETLFQAASISKPVAAMAVMKAIQDGLFSLDDDINTILTSWQLPASEFTAVRPVTPRMLTSHTAGLDDGFGFPGYLPEDPLPTTVQILNGEAPSNVGPVFMGHAPMTQAKYSGGGVTMMQLALSDAVGKPFSDFVQDAVLDPIGMTHSTFAQPLTATWKQHAARAHSRDGSSMNVKWHVYPELAAAGLWTTPSDLAEFAIEVQKSLLDKSNKVLSRVSVLEMLNPIGVGRFAVGFHIQQLGGGWYFGHTGSNWGFRCSLSAHKVKGYGVVIMTNAAQGARLSMHVRNRVARAYQWDSLED